ncbi:hypothetical protein C1Y41_06945 [Pantoea sp. ICBG 1758]|uniref:acyltransferase family protein n=1 Tax=Pantoea sp. ICBG 1758 TaxID=2071682 RepID=UPI000CE3F708|nr:acyltransferase [Pantoea sp. ICBG 1758]PPC64362.1 hypothetical protein C1Y41_06945 [Pantoea sp. ICBG 1758]
MIANNKSKIEAIEGIRGIACLMVFLSHLSSTFAPSMHTGSIGGVKTSIDLLLHNSPFAFIYSGAAAVGIFFVLSGFILSYAISKKGNIIENSSAMFLKRYFRLMPVALFSSVIAFLIFKYTSVDTSDLAQWAKSYDIKNPSIIDSIYYGSVTPFFSGFAPYNWSLWTMKIEFFGSAIICFLCCFITQVRYRKIIILICMIIPFLMNIKKGDDIYYASFMSGMLIYNIKSDINRHISFSMFLIGIYLCGFHTTSSFYQWLNDLTNLKVDGRTIDNYGLYNNLGGFLVVLSIIKNNFLNKIMSLKPLVYMGTLSFSVYALHQPIMHFTCPSIYTIMRNIDLTYSQAAALASLLTLIICYLVSIPTHKYVDAFSVKFSKKVQCILIEKITIRQ